MKGRTPERPGTLLAAVLLGGGLAGIAGCYVVSDCGESVALSGFDEPAFFRTPEVRQEDPRRVLVEAIPGALERALDAAQPGDVIRLEPGMHAVGSGGLSLTASGTPDRWIRVGGADGTRPVIDLRGRAEFRIAGSHVLLENVEIVNGRGNNLHLAPLERDVENVIVRNCKIHGLARGPGAAIKLNRNNPEGAGLGRIFVEGCDLAEAKDNAVIDGVGVRKAVVRGSYIHDNAKGSSGIFFKGGSSDILIEGNLVAGIRGNSAVKLGGSTGARYFDPAHPDQEGVNQIARNNLVADCDDSVFEIRGTKGCRIYHNTIVSQTGFAIFRFQTGNSATGRPSHNDDVEIVNNLIFATGGDPQFARNDGGPGDFRFRSNLWVGKLHNPGSAGPDIPRFPCRSDLTIAARDVVTVLRQPDFRGLAGLTDAFERFLPATASPAAGAGSANPVATTDARGRPRPTDAPAIGALEPR